MASSINASTSGPGGVITTADNSGILNLQSGGTTVATVNSSGLSTVGSLSVPNTFGFKNRLINGNFIISQYNGTSSVAPGSGQYVIDRWYADSYGSGANGYTVQQLSSSPPAGFNNYLQIQCNSTTYTNINITQTIESINSVDLLGQTVTVSFWYRIPVSFTGTPQVILTYQTTNNTRCGGGTGSSISSISLSNTSTWTKASFSATVPSNALSLGVIISNGNNNVINGAILQITGVQLELGSQATSFDVRSIGTELLLCQRYYYASANGVFVNDGQFTYLNGNNLTGAYKFGTTMRAQPTITVYNGSTANQVLVAGSATTSSVSGTNLISQSGFGGIQGSFTNSPFPFSAFNITAFAEL